MRRQINLENSTGGPLAKHQVGDTVEFNKDMSSVNFSRQASSGGNISRQTSGGVVSLSSRQYSNHAASAPGTYMCGYHCVDMCMSLWIMCMSLGELCVCNCVGVCVCHCGYVHVTVWICVCHCMGICSTELYAITCVVHCS